MKRTKSWWSKFTFQERGYIRWIERINSYYMKYGQYPEDYNKECLICRKKNSLGICNECFDKYVNLVNK